MDKVTVTTKEELQKAVNSEAETIIVTGKMVKILKKLKPVYNLGPTKTLLLAGAIGGSLSAIIATETASLALVPETAGISYVVGKFAEAGEVTAAAAATGTSVTVIAGLVYVGVMVGVTATQGLLRTYDLEESSTAINENGITFTKKYREHTKK